MKDTREGLDSVLVIAVALEKSGTCLCNSSFEFYHDLFSSFADNGIKAILHFTLSLFHLYSLFRCIYLGRGSKISCYTYTANAVYLLLSGV